MNRSTPLVIADRPGTSSPPPAQSLAGAEAAILMQRFPPRLRPNIWPATAASHGELLELLDQPPLRPGNESTHARRMVGARLLLEWLATHPGDTWQERWNSSPMSASPKEWHRVAKGWAVTIGRNPDRATLTSGLLALLCADAVRPDISWMTQSPSRFLRPAIAEARDPEGFAHLENIAPSNVSSTRDGSKALRVVAQIIAAYGGKVQDIVVGDFLAQIQVAPRYDSRPSHYAYTWLRAQGQFPADAPTTLMLIESRSGQVGPEGLVDRYRLKCGPVRDLIVEYMKERQPSLDYNSLRQLSMHLVKRFWADLEHHNPGINTLHLTPEVSDAWKARLATKVTRERQDDGSVRELIQPRISAPATKMAVRSFYLDIAQWAADEPERWGRWVARCPISEDECSNKKSEAQQRAKMGQRTRERLPALPTLLRVAHRRLKEAQTRLEALQQAQFDSEFTVLEETFKTPRSTNRSDGRPGYVYDVSGQRRDLGNEEKRAFWAWATIEVLRHTGIRIEELLELSHHSIIQYKLPTSGEIVPLLQIAPSKTDKERLLLVTPELADVLSAIVWRVRGEDGIVQSIASFDPHEKCWNAPMPLLYQWNVSGENRPVSTNTVRKALNETLAATGLTDPSGKPLKFQPHDFRRIFITDAILNGLPPHIAQVIAGHDSIQTTMGYAAIYPADAIEAHRAFIARRRAIRPTEEYRAVTPEEWQEFLGHFERRKMALGDCGRAYGTDCAHEHACVRCPALIVDHTERPRLVEIGDNLAARIAEADREGWLGETEKLNVSLTAAKEKISQIDARQERRGSSIFLGIPSFPQLVVRSSGAT